MADIATISTKDINGGLVLRVRVARSFTIRTHVACWLIRLASRVMDVPCEMELTEADEAPRAG